MQVKTQEQEEARTLRSAGTSINEIAKQLGVSKGSVSVWVRDISITEAQKATLKANSCEAGLRGFSKQTMHRNKRLDYQRVGMQLAEQLGSQPRFVGGCMLFWAEGDKDRNAAVLSNTDKYLMQYWWAFLQDYFRVQPDDVTLCVQCHLGNGYTVAEVECYWLSILALPKDCLRKTTVVTKQNGTVKTKHPYGVCRLTINNTELAQKLFGAIRYIAGIAEPCWLD